MVHGMSIEEIEIDFSVSSVPLAVRRLIDESNLHWKEFFGRNDDQKFPSLIPSDATVVFSVINAVTRQGLPPGQVFCEWGSGFGTGACLAALLGYRSFGIEIQPELAAFSRVAAVVDLEHGRQHHGQRYGAGANEQAA